jgi:glycogen synthase kinase 3 beta
VAIKKVYQDKRYKNREYNITKELTHPNVVKLHHAFYTTGEKPDEIYLNLVLNYVPDNLNRQIRNHVKNKEEFPIFLIKLYTFQMARALAYIHSQGVLHRDIKPQNILIDPSTNRVYICDFGSAKKLNGEELNVSYICSRYYRAPELIFGNTDYDSSIDIWSFGCVIAEMLIGKPFFQGENTIDQLLQIIKILGTPDAEQLSYLNRNNTLNCYQFPPVKPYSLTKLFSGKPKEIINLLQKIFVYEPNKRLTALEIMAHPFFDELKTSDLGQNSKFIIPNIFDFNESEINSCKNKSLLKKIIPDSAEVYKYIYNFIDK